MSLILVGVSLAGLWLGADDPVQAEMAKLAGSWQMIAAEKDGEKAPANWVAQRRFHFTTERQFKVTVAGATENAGIVLLDLKNTPKAADLMTQQGSFTGKTLYCIYELNGNSLKVCFATFGTERPKEFSSGPGSQHFTMLFERVQTNE